MIMDAATLLAFVLTAGAIVLSPGPDTVLILRYSLNSGRNVGLATVFGVQVGLIGHTLLAILGISVIVASSPFLFKSVAVLGAAYLAWIGIQGFRGTTLKFDSDGPAITSRKAIRDAALCNLLNPKVIILFLALLPNFVDPERGSVTIQLMILSAVLILINVIWQAPLAFAADAIRNWLSRPRVQKTVNASTGAFLLFFAALMLWEHLILH
ncbi:LysE family translocator [Terasakiella sp. A23]|uniref:LysE family translocator n=1 Tax=Terasakiella sp. FCG-A23 TaxID=3080561 RepID=UPI002954D7BC|nr:LysE family translocator [Terasakiella sp. A23]MDV7340785.1 LysE family translocator [Terasakiella sp. A23]